MKITFKKIIALLMSVLMLLSACSGKPASTGDMLLDTAKCSEKAV